MRKNFLTGLIVAFSIFGLFVSTEAETITKPYPFTDGTPAKASEVNANFDTVYEQVNKVGAEIHIDSANHKVGIGTTSPAVQLETSGQGTKVRNYVTAYGGLVSNDVFSVFIGRRARGSASTPAAVQSGDVLVHFGAKGYDGNNFSDNSIAGIRIHATETYDDANQGSNMTFSTTPKGSITKETRMKIGSSGKVGIGTTDPQSKLQVNGYIQLALTSGSPDSGDCDEASKYGRMKVDATSGSLYICVASGWVSK